MQQTPLSPKLRRRMLLQKSLGTVGQAQVKERCRHAIGDRICLWRIGPNVAVLVNSASPAEPTADTAAESTRTGG